MDVAAVCSHFDAHGAARYKTPEWVEPVERLPRNALGKVQKGLLVPRHR